MLSKKGYLSNLLIFFVVFAITIPTLLYFRYKDKLHALNSFNPPSDLYGTVASPTPTPPTPAAIYCEKQNGTFRIITNADGSKTGFCYFVNGNRCEQWAYYRQECEE